MNNSLKKKLFIISFLFLSCTAAYRGVADNDFVNIDDDVYITDNPVVKRGLTVDGMKWAFTTNHGNFLHPVTWLSHMTDYTLFGAAPRGHHIMALFVHIINSVLLFILLCKMTGAVWRSGFVSILFALHPLHVESVAWAAERKDLLCALFWNLTILAYVRYIEKPGIKEYLAVIAFFIFGLLSKPMIVTLPIVLLLLDIWPLERYRKRLKNGYKGAGLIIEKIPLLILSLVFSFQVVLSQSKGGALKSLDLFPMDARMSNALISYIEYIKKMIFPFNLAVFYPHPEKAYPLQAALSALFLISVTVIALKKITDKPFLTVGWLWFLITLFPVIGFIQVGGHAMADRYTYISLTGLFIVLGWAVPDRVVKGRINAFILCCVVCSVIVLSMLGAMNQVKYWKNSISLFAHAVSVTELNYLAHGNLGLALYDAGDMQGALRHYEEALKIRPDSIETNNNLGLLLMNFNKWDEAVTRFEKVLSLKPDYGKAHNNLGMALAANGVMDGAISRFRQAIIINNDNNEAHYNLAIALEIEGDRKGAIKHLREVLRIEPGDQEAALRLNALLRAWNR